jgi:two-component system LytT family sensor kinase
MLVQLLIENSIKHGISHEKAGGNVLLNIQKINQNIYIKVSNTGKIKEDKSDNDSAKIGIKNIISRLSLQYGKKASFRLFEEDNQVHACVLIPAETR